jgi:hypothetical protein
MSNELTRKSFTELDIDSKKQSSNMTIINSRDKKSHFIMNAENILKLDKQSGLVLNSDNLQLESANSLPTMISSLAKSHFIHSVHAPGKVKHKSD